MYINMIWENGERETVDQGTIKECRQWIKEYRMAYKGQYKRLYISQRCCKGWNE